MTAVPLPPGRDDSRGSPRWLVALATPFSLALAVLAVPVILAVWASLWVGGWITLGWGAAMVRWGQRTP